MIDRGLLWSGIVIAVVAWAFPRLVRGPRPPLSVDPLLFSAIGAVLIGRVALLAIEDPGALQNVRDVLVVRGGVAFWPAVAGGATIYAYLTRRLDSSAWFRLSAAAPTALAGYGAYEATCIVRDGCFGPAVGFGPTPPGLVTAMLPVGWIVAVLVLAWAAWQQQRVPREADLLFSLLVLAVVRGVAAFHLPRVGGALSSPHVQSILVAVVALAFVVGRGARDRHTTPSRSRPMTPTTTDE